MDSRWPVLSLDFELEELMTDELISTEFYEGFKMELSETDKFDE